MRFFTPAAMRIPLPAAKLSMQTRTPEQQNIAIALLEALSTLSPEHAAWYAQWKPDILRHKEHMQGQQNRHAPGSGI